MESYNDAATSGTALPVTRRPKPPPEPSDSEDMSAELRATFGANFKAARLAAGVSQEAVADSAGLGRAHISRIEAGSINITLETASKLAVAVGADARDLLGLCGGGRPKKNRRPG